MDYELGSQPSLHPQTHNHLTNLKDLSMYSKISDYLSSWCTDLISLLLLALHKVWKNPRTPDLTMTIPFDLKYSFWPSLLKARVLRQTELRRCWFDEASKDDKEANTRLGTLRFLPYEIREQIFKIVLENYFDEFNLERRRYGTLTKWQLNYEGWVCHCKVAGYKTWDVFNLISYCCVTESQYKTRAPLNLRFASESLREESDHVFLASNTFEFTCPASLERFMNELSPLQQRHLRRIKLHIVGYMYWNCFPNISKVYKRWMAVCERLPPRLVSVQFILSYHWGISNGIWTGNNRDRGFGDVLELLSKRVSRACPRAKISMAGRDKFCEEYFDVLNAMLQELEPWSKEWHEWMDRGA